MRIAAVERSVDTVDLEEKVKDMYQRVALDPYGEFHFETGRALAERLGYDPRDLDQIPSEALDSFAGVGFHFDLAQIKPGEHVLDLGSGSGTDTFIAALKTGTAGKVYGVDMTDAQRGLRHVWRSQRLDTGCQKVSALCRTLHSLFHTMLGGDCHEPQNQLPRNLRIHASVYAVRAMD